MQTTPDALAPPVDRPVATTDTSMTGLVAQMRQHFDRADRALRDGDLALYAEEMRKAKDILEKMEKIGK